MSPSNATPDLPAVGTRFTLSGYIGTVRYVGQVDGTSGMWLGVDWDDGSRGKHDGIKDGKRYFSCL
jgi:dynactin complex subunit